MTPTLTPPADPDAADAWELMTPDQQERWSERAAIAQYDGNLTRDQAEDQAWRALEEVQSGIHH